MALFVAVLVLDSCPLTLSVGGPDTEQLGFKEPMKWMRESKKITMEELDHPTKFTAMEPDPADCLSDLLYQVGAFKPAVIKKEWLVALLQQLKRIASTTGSDNDNDTEWTHPDCALVCRHRHP